jgi:hypothetical protein
MKTSFLTSNPILVRLLKLVVVLTGPILMMVLSPSPAAVASMNQETGEGSRAHGIARSDAIAFSDDFTTDPNTNGLWTIHRYTDDPVNEASWDIEDGVLFLVRPAFYKGAAMFANYELTSQVWRARFRYKAGGGSGADGFVFMFYKDKAAYGIPGYGGFFGFTVEPYLTPVDGYGVEFDNFLNPDFFDPSPNHIAIIQDTVTNHLKYVDDLRTEDNLWHTVQVHYDHGLIVVTVDGKGVLRYQIKHPDYSFSGVGFGGGTGGSTNNQIIDDFVLTIE